MNKIYILVPAAVIIIAAFAFTQLGIQPKTENILEGIYLPDGLSISVFAEDLGSSPVSSPGPSAGPRMMLLKDDIVYVSITGQGSVVALEDTDNDNIADRKTTFISGLNNPHGIDYMDGFFYIAEESRVIRVRDDDNDKTADENSLEVIIPDIPTGGHFTRTIKARDEGLYVSVGSSCNVCHESSEWRAAITRCDLDGSNCTSFATGLRNSVGFVFHNGSIYATDNGRDWLGDDAPPEEINVVEEGRDYGWPICYGNKIHDTEFDKNTYVRNPCEDTEAPLAEMQAHSAPLGLLVYSGEMFSEYAGDIFVAFHGSWNRNEPTGYKVVRVRDGNVNDFASEWLKPEGVAGRPVDIIMYTDGSILVSDDFAGKIYRISGGRI